MECRFPAGRIKFEPKAAQVVGVHVLVEAIAVVDAGGEDEHGALLDVDADVAVCLELWGCELVKELGECLERKRERVRKGREGRTGRTADVEVAAACEGVADLFVLVHVSALRCVSGYN